MQNDLRVDGIGHLVGHPGYLCLVVLEADLFHWLLKILIYWMVQGFVHKWHYIGLLIILIHWMVDGFVSGISGIILGC